MNPRTLTQEQIKKCAHQIGEMVDTHTALDMVLQLVMFPFEDMAFDLLKRAEILHYQ